MMSIKSFPVVSALHDLPLVGDLASCEHDATMILRERSRQRLNDPVILDIQEPLSVKIANCVNAREQPLDPLFLSSFINASLIGNRLVVTADGFLVPDFRDQASLHTVFPSRVWQDGSRHFDIPFKESCRFIPGASVALFFSPGSGNNHSHFLIQTLPQLHVLSQAGISCDRLIVLPSIRRYQYDFLNALGYSSDQILIRDPSDTWTFERLYVCYVSGDVLPNTNHISMIKQSFPSSSQGSRRIYVSRSDARGFRRFINEHEIIPIFEAAGFDIITPSTLSAEDEVRIFRDARIVVGPLGAGLYNSVFAEPGAAASQQVV